MKSETIQSFLNFNPKLQRELVRLHPELREILIATRKKKRFAKWGAANKQRNYAQHDWKDQIIDALEVREVMEYYGVHFNSRGFAKCPFHDEKTASLSVKNNRFKCFGCGAGGNAIDFVILQNSIPFREAMIKLDNDFRLDITNQEMTLTENKRLKQVAADRELLKIEHEQFKRYYLSEVGVFQYLQKSISTRAPTDPYTDNWHPVFTYAAQHLSTLENWLDEYTDIYSNIRLYEKYKKEGRLPYWEML